MIDVGQNDENKFTIEEKSNSNMIYGIDTSNPPLVVVVQGGKKVSFEFFIFYNLVRKININQITHKILH
jgi:hypothetical protein